MALNGIAHKELTDPQLHELKGASTAQAGQVPFADGEGHTSWRSITVHDVSDVAILPSPTGYAGRLLVNNGVQAFWGNTLLSHITFNAGITCYGNSAFERSVSLGSSATAATPANDSNDTSVATTAYVNNKLQVVSSLPQSPDSDTFYFIMES